MFQDMIKFKILEYEFRKWSYKDKKIQKFNLKIS